MAYRANVTYSGSFQSSPTRITSRNVSMVSPRQLSTGRWGSGLSERLPSISAVTVNPYLLNPVNVAIDPEYHQIRTEEKEQIKVLNNQFASFIDKVRYLEQQNKILETKWNLLQQQTTARSNVDSMFEAYIANLRHHLDSLSHEEVRLKGQMHNTRDLMEDFKEKYEKEIEKRTSCENEFVLMNKDADLALVTRAELEATLDNANDEVQFLKMLYDMELQELQAQVKDTSVVVQMDNSRNLDMDAVVAEAKAQYEDISNHSRAEAEAWYKHKYEEMQVSATKYSDELKSSKAEIAEYNHRITRLHSEMELLREQRKQLEAQISEAEEHGQQAVEDAHAQIKDLKAALQRAKQDMAGQVREYHGLMNIKLALDIEIATYRKLLEGEESRLAHGIKAINISRQTSLNFNSFPLKTSGTTLELHPPSLIGPSRDMDASVPIKKQQIIKQAGPAEDIIQNVTVTEQQQIIENVGMSRDIGVTDMDASVTIEREQPQITENVETFMDITKGITVTEQREIMEDLEKSTDIMIG